VLELDPPLLYTSSMIGKKPMIRGVPKLLRSSKKCEAEDWKYLPSLDSVLDFKFSMRGAYEGAQDLIRPSNL